MELKDVILIGIAMSMDALGLTISLGINPYLVKRNKIRFILSFAFFQFIFLFSGGIAGRFFDTYIVSIPNMIGGIIISFIGLIMIISAFKNSDKDDSLLIKKSMYIILGMSVSVDALVVGFTAFYSVNPILTFVDAMLVGLITLLLCTTGFFLCRYARRIDFICKYADILGGLILLCLGIEMILF
ncbi:MAG: manganese efflux pump [Clostridium sp.]|uniref:manganese efflux pump MntP n=1 Tax=Clostridium sp. TaxID=1506 RepID=UPI0025C01E32|nr:manganese efflux pump [Clostridium sp.]MCF0149711.1 manganese efflux pump [Clostridium sp.]